MPRRIFPASTVTNTTGAPLRLEFYPTSTSVRREADLWTIDGSNNLVERISNGVIVTSVSGAYSAFAGPDDLDTLYVLPSNTTSRTTLTATDTVAGGTTVDTATFAKRSNNLSDLASASSARTSLGLGASAVMSTAQIAADSALTGTFVPKTVRRRSLPGSFVGAYNSIYGLAFASGATSGFTSRAVHKVPYAVSEIRFVYPEGYYLTTSGEAALAQGVTLKASLEYGSASYPVTFNGMATATCSPGGTLVSDPIAIELPAAATFYSRSYLDLANGEFWAQGATPMFIGSGLTADNSYTQDSDVTGSTGALVTNAASSGLWTPAIIGTAASGAEFVSLAGMGDSIMTGVGDGSVNAGVSWLTRLTNATVPLFRYSLASLRLDQIRAKPQRGLPLLANASHVLVHLGTNDITLGSRTYTQLKADTTWLFNYLNSRGCKVIGATILPRTTSTDSWATTGNQTPVTGFAAAGHRENYNTWIRGGADGLTNDYWDLADAVESSRNSGVWTSSYTGDGIHPNTTGHTAMATAMASKLAALTP